MLTKQAAQLRARNFKKVKPSYLRLKEVLKNKTIKIAVNKVDVCTTEVQGIIDEAFAQLKSLDEYFEKNMNKNFYAEDCQPRIATMTLETEVLEEELKSLRERVGVLVTKDGGVKYLTGKIFSITTDVINKRALVQSVVDTLELNRGDSLSVFERMEICFSSSATLEIE